MRDCLSSGTEGSGNAWVSGFVDNFGIHGVEGCVPRVHANCRLGGMSTSCCEMRCLEMFWAEWLEIK